MRASLQQYTLTECLLNIIDYRGKTPKKLGLEWCETGYRAISANNVKFDGLTKTESINCLNEIGYKKWMKDEVKRGDLLLTSEAPAGQVMLWMSDEKIVLSQRLFALRTKPDVYNKYLKYYLQSNIGQFEINKNTSGSTVFGISAKMFDFIKVNLPDYDSQISIGDLLYLLDSKIELNNKINAELEAIAKTLYDYWFVQFDFPDIDGKPYKTSGGKMVWNDELKKEIPFGWKDVRLSDIVSLLARGISPKYIQGEGVSVLNQKCVRNKSVDFAQGRKHDNTIRSVTSKLIQIGDILVNSTGVGTLGRVAVVKWLKTPQTTVDSHVTIVRIDGEKVNKCFVGYSISEKQGEIEQLGEGSTGQTELSRENLGKLKLIIPSPSMQLSFEKILSPQLQKIANNEKENQRLTEFRDWLLPMLINGQVSVN